MVQVYISSTFSDLEDCRRAVYHALRRMQHDVIAMEDYVATPRRPLDECLRDVARCELYIGIFAWRYGFIPEVADPAAPEAGNPEQKSITELEYLHAERLGKDRLIFLLHEDAYWPKSRMEGGAGAERIEAFRKGLGDKHGVDFFTDVGDLTTKVSTAVSVWQKRRKEAKPSDGQPKAEPPEAPEVNVGRLPVTGGQLFGREAELKALDDAWTDDDTHIISFIAWGGVGKSALVNKWLSNLARDDYRGAEKVYGWSFYRQGTSEQGVSADQFVDAALRWFCDSDPTAGTPWDKGERLARLIKGRRTLLLLDGLEPLQFPPGRGQLEGALKEHSMQALLRELAAHNPGLCVITSRLAVADIADSEGATTRRINLEHLSPRAGAEVLRGQGVKGGQAELERATAEFGGHALALTLLGGYLTNVHDGDIARRDRVGLLREDEERGGHARRVMASYEQWLGEGPALAVLRMLGLFDRPADGPALDALRAAPAIPGLTDALQGLNEEDWQRTLQRLRTARLIAARDPNHPDTLDTHPLVREYFRQRLKSASPEAWREGNSRLFEHIGKTVKEFPDTMQEALLLLAAVAHGCAANRHQEALDELYWRRIRRGTEIFVLNKLGAFGASLAALTGFFGQPWQQPLAVFSEEDKAFLMNEAGLILRALGQSVEAARSLRTGLEARTRLEDWKNAGVSASNLSELYLSLGDIDQALVYAQRSVELADRTEFTFDRLDHRTVLAAALYRAARLSEAESNFREAEEMLREWRPDFPRLILLPGFRYCALLLHQGKYQEVETRTRPSLELGMRNNAGPLVIACDHLSLGRASLQRRRREGAGDLLQAASHLNSAVDGLRQAGILEYLCQGLLARAELRRISGEFNLALGDLNEAMSISTRCGMELYQADCHLEYARLHPARDGREKARGHWRTAKEMVKRMKYHLRDEEVLELERALGEEPAGDSRARGVSEGPEALREAGGEEGEEEERAGRDEGAREGAREG